MVLLLTWVESIAVLAALVAGLISIFSHTHCSANASTQNIDNSLNFPSFGLIPSDSDSSRLRAGHNGRFVTNGQHRLPTLLGSHRNTRTRISDEARIVDEWGLSPWVPCEPMEGMTLNFCGTVHSLSVFLTTWLPCRLLPRLCFVCLARTYAKNPGLHCMYPPSLTRHILCQNGIRLLVFRLSVLKSWEDISPCVMYFRPLRLSLHAFIKEVMMIQEMH
ncbi:hypothetical protein C2E23DRAFT_243288 [Lenzites betulinus]|nr:hypothetical protein C2E23DRAFT_243288 [Lenzites betulinus]